MIELMKNSIPENCNVKLSVEGPDSFNIIIKKLFEEDTDSTVLNDVCMLSLPEGIYSLTFSAAGYCNEEHVVVIKTGENYMLNKEIRLKKLSGEKAEFKGCLYVLPDSFENKLYSDFDIYNQFDFETPGFSSEKNDLQFTTIEECAGFLENVSKNNPDIKVFSVNGLPVVMVCKEPCCEDAFEYIKKVRGNGKINILYQAQIHGTEPASGEGALTVINRISKRRMDNCISDMNLMIIPICNPEGANSFSRECGNVDMNRDCMQLKAYNTETLHRLFKAFMPEVAIDAHTFTRANGIRQPYVDRSALDVRLSSAQSKNIDKEVRKIADSIVKAVHNNVKGSGLRTGYYGDSVDPTTSRGFYGLFNTCSFLLETEGSRSGRMHFKRNVYGHYKTVTEILNTVKANAEEIKAAVDEARKKLIDNGDAAELFVIEHGKTMTKFYETAHANFDFEGNVIDKDYIIKFPEWDTCVKMIKKPYAYIISGNENQIENILSLLQKHDIDYIIISDDTEIECMQFFREDNGEITLSPENITFFECGSILIPVNQILSNVICTLFEPAYEDAKNGPASLFQMKLLTVNKDGTLNLYKQNKKDVS